jgi:sugar/nucleoside kinase (ribokinase family)
MVMFMSHEGAKAADWIKNGALQHQPGFSVDVVDTTGLGMFFTVRWHSAWRGMRQ